MLLRTVQPLKDIACGRLYVHIDGKREIHMMSRDMQLLECHFKHTITACKLLCIPSSGGHWDPKYPCSRYWPSNS